jgi:hypothetical protein
MVSDLRIAFYVGIAATVVLIVCLVTLGYRPRNSQYDWIRAQSRQMPKYQAWANDVAERARKWFDAEIPEGMHFIRSDFEQEA